jgi:hypothetical protein
MLEAWMDVRLNRQTTGSVDECAILQSTMRTSVRITSVSVSQIAAASCRANTSRQGKLFIEIAYAMKLKP